jgi:hypothetical protein
MRKSFKLLTALSAAFSLVVLGITPANAEKVGKQNFADAYDANGLSDIIDVQVDSTVESPWLLNIYVTVDAVVPWDVFIDDLIGGIEIDTDADGSDDYWFVTPDGRLSPEGVTKTIWDKEMQDTGCEALFFGFPDEEVDYFGAQIDTSCLELPETFGLLADVSSLLGDDYDSAPDEGFYEVVNPTSAQILLSLAKTPVPTIEGNKSVGSQLTAKPGTWDTGVSLTYQWLREGTPIATGITYTATSADLGKAITVAVTGTKIGYQSATTTSSPVVIITPALSKTVTPTINGSAKPGSTLIANTGQWDSGVAFTFQWLRDDSPIANQTASVYQTTAGDINRSISVRVVGSKAGYQSATLTSARVLIKASKLSKTPTPTISGTTKAGKTLSAKAGTWDSGVKLSYQWLRNGVAIKGATKTTYKLATADKGKKISVRVTGTKSGYETAVKTSAAKTISK